MIPPGVLESADVAGAFDVAIWQETLLGGGIPLFLGFCVEITLFLQGAEHGLRHLEMVLGVCAGEQVVAEP